MTCLGKVFHDAWCAVTRRCGWEPDETPILRWLKEQEREANRSAEALRVSRDFSDTLAVPPVWRQRSEDGHESAR